MQTEFELRSDGLWGPKMDPEEIRAYTFEFTDMDTFETESIAVANWTVTDCTKHGQSNTTKTATVVVKLPTSTTLSAKCEITTSPSGYKFVRSFKAEVGAR